MHWIDINEQKPEYYTNVTIDTGEEILENFHRLSDGDTEYYGSLETNKIVFKIVKWRPIVKMIAVPLSKWSSAVYLQRTERMNRDDKPLEEYEMAFVHLYEMYSEVRQENKILKQGEIVSTVAEMYNLLTRIKANFSPSIDSPLEQEQEDILKEIDIIIAKINS